MINNKKIISIIPARGGSKGLPGKNIRMLSGKPLVAWTVEKAKKSKYIDLVIVSTDSHEIADISKKYGAIVPFIRPEDLATDHATTISVIEHALEWYRMNKGQEFDITIILEPTSPLREDDDIDKMIEALMANEEDYDSIVSVGEVSEHPSIMKKLIGKGIEPFCPELKQTTRRQDNVPAYFPYGVGYIAKTTTLQKERTFYTSRCMHYLIKRYQNYEIDDLYDFICIESIMKYEWRLK